MRLALMPLVIVATLAATVAEAQRDYPVNYIKVDELKAELDRGTKADIIDVRNWQAYVDMHIKGARSMPLRSVAERSAEITKKGLVVFY